MTNRRHRWWGLFSIIAVVVFTAGCFQQVGDTPQDIAIAERISETPSPEPSATDTPTITPTEEFVAEAVDLPASDLSTPEGTSVAQVGDPGTLNQADNYSLTATEIIRTVTQGAVISITETAQALGLGATATETPTFFPTDNPFVTSTPTTVFLSGADCVHEVRQGETMFRLSMYYGIAVNQIAAANGVVNANLIVVGQRLVIPSCGTTGAVPPPTSTATEAVSFGVGGATTTDLSLGQGGGFTSLCGPTYIVEQYDTLFQISLRCGVPVQSIANANGITNINVIDMGTTLTIPSQ